ncbi:unnamed protein product [Peronospora belbahrii]|uniref:Lipid-binding serum glycoprotein N-terminal domain-containing protein n=1 Tax=Peronospora belbahrii TaxID=622444 RepID=A0AAU9KSP8_9STRA|nr:unnamed protein product [Peronospora belbahrii]CAH0517670.1 unnamed protein product [Peronospora belbahrii]
MVKYLKVLTAFAAVMTNVFSFGNNGGRVVATNFDALEIPDKNVTATSLRGASRSRNNTNGLTAKNACVLAKFTTATEDFIALNNIVDIINASPSVLKQYVADPFVINDRSLPTFKFKFRGYTFNATVAIDWLNVTGTTTMAPMAVNVTSASTLDVGTRFTGNVTLTGSLTVDLAQHDHKWYQICWVNPLRPIYCEPSTIKMALILSVYKPQIAAHVRANLYECAPGIPTSVCQNLTVSSIMADAMAGNITHAYTSILKNFKDARVNTVALNWDYVSNIYFDVYQAEWFLSKFIGGLYDFSVERLNQKKGYYHRVFLDVAHTILLSLTNTIIDALKPLFGYTCL